MKFSQVYLLDENLKERMKGKFSRLVRKDRYGKAHDAGQSGRAEDQMAEAAFCKEAGKHPHDSGAI
jgi:hypothetical protein